MDIHIDKKVAALMITSLMVGVMIGGIVSFVAAGEEGHGGRSKFERGIITQFDDHADGETDDDQGGMPNQDKQQPMTSATQSSTTPPSSNPTAPVKPQ